MPITKVVGDAELCRDINSARNPETRDHLQHGYGWRDIRIARFVALSHILCLVWMQNLKKSPMYISYLFITGEPSNARASATRGCLRVGYMPWLDADRSAQAEWWCRISTPRNRLALRSVAQE